MARDLANLIAEANSVFPDNFIIKQYERNPPELRPVEILAQYLVADIRELYDPYSNDRENLGRIITNFEIATVNLEAVTKCFRELHQSSLP